MKNSKKIEEIKKSILPILIQHKVTKAGIFGSFARGEQTKKSDVDILIDISLDFDLIDVARLKNLIQKKLKRKVDLVEYDCIRSEIKEDVLKDEIPIIR